MSVRGKLPPPRRCNKCLTLLTIHSLHVNRKRFYMYNHPDDSSLGLDYCFARGDYELGSLFIQNYTYITKE